MKRQTLGSCLGVLSWLCIVFLCIASGMDAFQSLATTLMLMLLLGFSIVLKHEKCVVQITELAELLGLK